MLKILVLDEDSDMRALVSEWLCAAGYVAVPRASVGLAAEPDVGLIVADIPTMSAPTVAQQSRLDSLYPLVPRIGLSVQLRRSLPGPSELARSLGLRRLLAKPCQRQELLAAVHDASGAPASW